MAQGLDADRTRQCDHRLVETVCVQQLTAPVGGLGGGVDHIGELTAAVQDGQAVGPADERQALASGERIEERDGPDVLVDIDVHRRDLRSHR